MKKYKVWGQIGTHSFDMIIEADHFTYSQSVYLFINNETKQEWYFPIDRTVIETIVEQYYNETFE